MTTLVSPGVDVTIDDASAYASPGTGTIPLIVLATAQNKIDPTNTESDGIAKYTKASLSGLVVPVTSQRELVQYFGEPTFAATEGAETSEYGLLAAYSYLGQGSQAYIVRAGIDLDVLVSAATAPTGPVGAGKFWIDTDASSYGVHEYNGTAWISKSVTVEVDLAASAGELTDPSTYTPVATAVNDTYLVTILSDGVTSVEVAYWRGEAGAWEILNDDWETANTQVLTFAAHYAAPASPTTGDIWVKTTQPGSGLNLVISRTDAAGVFELTTVAAVNSAAVSAVYVAQNGSSLTDLAGSLTNTNLVINMNASTVGGFALQQVIATAPAEIATVIYAQDAEPTGTTADGTIWYSNDSTDLDILVRAVGGWSRIAAADIQYNPIEPVTDASGAALTASDVWVDTSASPDYPVIYKHNGTMWLSYDNTDQTTDRGVLFSDFTDETRVSLVSGVITEIAGSLDYQLYPTGMLAVNMAQSANTVRAYDATAGAWRNYVSNNANGSGVFGRLAQHKVIATSMQAAIAGNEDLRDMNRNFTLIAAPNFPELTDELVTLNSDRGETAFIIIDTPMRKTPSEAVVWIAGNGATENNEDGLVTKNTYSAAYYPSGRSTTPAGNTVTVPASHMMLYTYAYNDNVSYPWFAPAGTSRGIIQNGSAVGYITSEGEFKEVSLNNGQRDAMYINKLNPIVNFAGQGVMAYGQKTLHPVTSSLDRVNVARLVAYLNERFENIAIPLLFTQNDQLTRDRAKFLFETFLSEIMSKRGISDFIVVCDLTNNTSLRRARNELYIDVAISAIRSVEFIYIPIRLDL
jgi:hypothetical protein